MSMRFSLLLLACVAAILAAASSSGKADVTVNQVSNGTQYFTPAQLAKMPAPVRAMMAKGTSAQPATPCSMYVKGKRVRFEVATSIYITTLGSSNVCVVDRGTRTYCTLPQNAYYTGALGGKPFDMRFVPIGSSKPKTIFGHKCVEYKLSTTQPIGKITGDIWVAPDLPTPPIPVAEGMYIKALLKHWHEIHGMPLAVNITISSKTNGRIVFTTTTESITTAPVDPSLFTPPAGYRKTGKPIDIDTPDN
jgi:hypothetical protein